MDEIVQNFHKSDVLAKGAVKELEVRMYISESQWKTMFSNIAEHSKLQKTEHIMSAKQDGGTTRIDVKFLNGKKIDEQYIEKTIVKSIKSTFHKVALSIEKPIAKFDLSSTNMIRFKKRTIMTRGDWSYHFTIVDLIKKNEYGNLKHFIELFSKDKLITPYRSYELEIEFDGKETSTKEIQDLISSILSSLGIKQIAENLGIVLKIARLMNFRGATVKALSNNPITLSLSDYYIRVLPQIQKYYLTDKIDGIRAFLYCADSVGHIVSDSEHKQIKTTLNNCILDVEYADSHIFVFDALMLDGKRIDRLPFAERWALLQKLKIDDENISLKEMVELTDNYKQQIKDLYTKKQKYENDGLIFTPRDGQYSNMIVYKWKPPAHDTIDFIVKKCPLEATGKEPYIRKEGSTLYLLFSGVDYNTFKTLNLRQVPFYSTLFNPLATDELFPIHFTPSLNPTAYIFHYSGKEDLDGKVVELRWDKTKWEFSRIRHDRATFGNHFKVAEIIYSNYINPFHYEKLFETNNSYFKVVKQQKYVALAKFHRFVVWNIFHFLQDANLVYDLACGKGQDIYLYHGRKVKQLVAADQDVVGITELINRKYSMYDKRFYKFDFNPNHKMSINAMVMDLTAPDVKKFARYGKASAVVINFAIHYLINSKATLDKLFELIDSILDFEGVFIFTCLNGEDVLSLPKHWTVDEGGEVKYGIKRKADKLDFSTQIEVIHPFSNGEYYPENVVDIRKIIARFKKSGYSLVNTESFSQMFDLYSDNRMNEQDRKYSRLYYYTVLRKKSAPGVRTAGSRGAKS